MKYKGVVFLPEKMRSGFEVGYIDAKLDECKQINEREFIVLKNMHIFL